MTFIIEAQHLPRFMDIKGLCRFCSLSDEEPLLHASAGVMCVPSIGAMVEGWTLVVPRRHVLSISELDDLEWSDFSAQRDIMRARVEAVYGQTVVFEHGAGGAHRTAGCGVDHAHMHIVPVSFDLRAIVSSISSEVGKFAWRSADDRPSAPAGVDYIHIGDATGYWIAFNDEQPSQVIRRAIAHQLDIHDWDWKANPRLTNVRATLEKLG